MINIKYAVSICSMPKQSVGVAPVMLLWNLCRIIRYAQNEIYTKQCTIKNRKIMVGL